MLPSWTLAGARALVATLDSWEAKELPELYIPTVLTDNAVPTMTVSNWMFMRLANPATCILDEKANNWRISLQGTKPTPSRDK